MAATQEMAGQVAIVTGSASGIGRAAALAFARAGARVVVNYSRSADEAQETADLVRDAGSEALVVQANVASAAEVDALVQQTLNAWGRVDVLVNSAGTTVFKPYTSLEDLDALTEADWGPGAGGKRQGGVLCLQSGRGPDEGTGQRRHHQYLLRLRVQARR